MDAGRIMLAVLMRAQSITDFKSQSQFIVNVLKAAKVYEAYYALALKEWKQNVDFFMADVSKTCKVELDNNAHSLKIAYSKNSIEYDCYTPLTLKWFNEWDLTLKEEREKKQNQTAAKATSDKLQESGVPSA